MGVMALQKIMAIETRDISPVMVMQEAPMGNLMLMEILPEEEVG